MKKIIKLTLCFLFMAMAMVSPTSAGDAPIGDEPAMVVGRVYHIEGDLLRYVPEEKDWVAVVKDAPFGAEDTLFSGSKGMAELIVPNGIWVRIGNSTQIQFIALQADLAEMDVASGMVRVYSKSSQAATKVTSPFGYVLADPGTIFDLYVGENSIEVVAIKGTMTFVHSATDVKYEVTAGTTSILADTQYVSSGEGTVDPDWNRWNMVRENFWLAKNEVRGQSVEYLPPSLHDEAYAFEENGRWEMVPYEGRDRWFWRPTTVAVGWSPFTVGRWTDWYGEQTWIPAEPFGYVTHHYGNWVYARNYWYWAPPVASVRVGLPLLDIGFHWFPGRVSWIHSGIYVGWVPLAPRETYYCRRHWGGPHTVVVNTVNITRININVRNYAYVNRAVVVNRDNFYRVNNYRNVRVTNINRTTIINNYRAAPVINNTVINNYTADKRRYNYTNVRVNEKPHNTVISRIQENRTVIHEGTKENASTVKQRVKGVPEGRVNPAVRVDQPRGTNYIVPAREMNRPKSEIPLQQREIKKRAGGGAAIGPAQVEKPAASTGRPAQRSERIAPATPPQLERPAQPATPAPRPERVTPKRPAEGEKPVPPPARPVPKPERVAPATPPQLERPAQPAAPVPRAERVTPKRPAEGEKPVPPPARPVPKPERVAPATPPQLERPAQPATPVPRPERVAPEKSAQQEKFAEPGHGQPPDQSDRGTPARSRQR